MPRPLRICVVVFLQLLLAAQAAARTDRPEVWLDGDRVKTSRRVMFKSGLVQFTDDSIVIVDAVAAFARQQGDVVVVVEGHTDAGGDETENLRLSQGRADELCRALMRRGIAADRVQAIGRGSAVPLVAADHREQYRNRRVELFLRPASAAAGPNAASDTDTVAVVAPLLLDDEPADAAANRPRIALLDDDETPPRPPRVTLLDDDDLLLPRFAGPAVFLLDEIGHPDR